MDSDDKAARQQELTRARQAERILTDPLWVASWESYLDHLKAWATDPTVADEVAMQAREKIKVLTVVRKEFERHIQTGEMAKIQLDGK